jgi:hypothetical protein
MRPFILLFLLSATGGMFQTLPAQAAPKVNKLKTVKSAAISQVTVTSVSTWNAGMTIIATIDSTVMDADAQGHFTGLAHVKWWTSMIGSAGCGAAEHPTPPSKAHLSAELDSSNQWVVTITFEPRDFSGFATCVASISTSNLATPDSLTIIVPAAGGTFTQPHAVTAKNGSFIGSATSEVIPTRK